MKEILPNGGENKTDAAFYSGLFFSAFPLAETLSGFWWGTLSDRIGRKPALVLGLCGTIVSALVIGLAENVWVAILGRALGGALNGNAGVVQTVMAELTRNVKFECMTVSPFPSPGLSPKQFDEDLVSVCV